MSYNPKVIEDRMNKAKNHNQFYMLKILALKRLGDILGFKKGNPYTEKILPYDRDLITELINRMYMQGLPEYIYVANAELLDYYCPFWRECVDDKIIGKVVNRNSKEVKNWINDVLKRDNYRCQDCGSTENLHAHHILDWSTCPESRIMLDNGITLCNHCHGLQHDNYNFVSQKHRYDR